MEYLYRLTNPDLPRVEYIEDKYAKLEATPIPWCDEHDEQVRHGDAGDPKLRYCSYGYYHDNRNPCRLEPQAVYRIQEIAK